nr:SPOR domain-containing protein [uncultured Sphingomonas sp.]
MNKSNRIATALAAVSAIALVSACSSPNPASRSASIFGSKVDKSNIGLATRAQAALAENDVQQAIALAEKAVENTPNDAGFRTLLGNCYMAAGRFSSAEAAYKDSLSLMAQQPGVIMKLALVQISLGKNDDALALLQDGQDLVDHADLGLAVALAGNPQGAIQVLEPLARVPGADARTRQNLALSYALSGNWEQARIVASQDLAADQVDARIQQWMAMSKPGSQVEQVASFIGLRPSAGDPGQPVRLALNKDNGNVRMAEAQQVVEPAAAEPIQQVADVQSVPAPAEAAYAPEPTPVVMAAAERVEAPVVLADTGSSVTVAMPEATPAPVVAAAHASKHASPVLAGNTLAHPGLTSAARVKETVAGLRRAAVARQTGNSRFVVQLGAYSSKAQIHQAWAKVTSRFGRVGNYQPVSARYNGPKGTFYRLAVKGFANDRDALKFCAALKNKGRACFVRNVAGDAPVQFASR